MFFSLCCASLFYDMDLPTTLFLGLIFHFIGDYLLQNDWMAGNKTKRHLPAFVHATIYSLPFLLILPWEYVAIILTTHFFIDRFRLASYWVNNRFYSNGREKPMFLTFWIMVIVDNTIHVIINTMCIFLFFK